MRNRVRRKNIRLTPQKGIIDTSRVKLSQQILLQIKVFTVLEMHTKYIINFVKLK